MEIILVIIVLILIFISIFQSPKDLQFLNNPLIIIIIVISIGTITAYSRLLGILLIILIALSYMNNNIERFDVVENDVDKVIEYTDDSFIMSLQNDEDAVTGVWGCSTLGKDMGLCKA